MVPPFDFLWPNSGLFVALEVGFSMLHWLVYGATVGKSKDFVPDDALALARTCAGHLWNSHAPCFGRCGVLFS